MISDSAGHKCFRLTFEIRLSDIFALIGNGRLGEPHLIVSGAAIAIPGEIVVKRGAIIRIAKVARTFHDHRFDVRNRRRNGLTDRDRPISQICADLKRGAMFVVYQHPFELDRPKLAGHFCDATIRVDAD